VSGFRPPFPGTPLWAFLEDGLAKVERQELHCHNCGKYVQFDLDMELDGNHVLECPNCKHEHCRVVKKGKITDTRWDQRNGQGTPPGHVAPNGMMVHPVSTATISTSTTSTYTVYATMSATSDSYLYCKWLNTTANA
jgi:hypothetical protein